MYNKQRIKMETASEHFGAMFRIEISSVCTLSNLMTHSVSEPEFSFRA